MDAVVVAVIVIAVLLLLIAQRICGWSLAVQDFFGVSWEFSDGDAKLSIMPLQYKCWAPKSELSGWAVVDQSS